MIDALKPKYRGMYMQMAYVAESQTEAKREKVGCVIVTREGVILVGFNGQPPGHHTNCCENTEVEERNLSGLLTYRMKTDRSVLHAENNAIGKAARAGVRLEGAHMFVTVSPCDPCARQIIPSGITHVFYDRIHDDLTGLEMLGLAGIYAEHWQELNHESAVPVP